MATARADTPVFCLVNSRKVNGRNEGVPQVFAGCRCWGLALLLVGEAFGFLASGQSHAKPPAKVFAAGPGTTVGAAAEAWHRELEEEGDYTESWYFLVYTDDGGVLIASFSITNLGLRTFDAAVDAHFYGPGGERFGGHGEYRREDIVAQPDRLDLAVGRNRIWREGQHYRMVMSEQGMTVRLDVRGRLPARQIGDGRIHFDADDDTDFFAIGLSVPRGECSGVVSMGAQSMPLRGWGYHGHSWTTVKLPSFLTTWSGFWIFDPELTLVLQEQTLSDGYGGGRVHFGVLGDADTLFGEARGFGVEPERWERDEASGYEVPSAWRVRGEAGGYRVSGILRREKLLQSVDVLGVLSWPVRTLVKALYGKPFTMRYVVRYDLTLVDAVGKSRRLRGTAPLEASYYRQPPFSSTP